MRYLLIFLTCCGLLSAQSTINEDTVHFVGQASAFSVGSELVTDGGFPSFDNWTEGTWTLGAGVASEDNAGGDSDLTQSLSGLTNGRVYRIQFEVTAYTDGNVTAVFRDTEIGDKSATGVFTGYLAARATAADLDIRADATFTGSVDNVSVVAWVGDSDAGGGTTIATFTGTLTDYMTATGGVLHNASGLALSNSGGLLAIAAATTWDQTPIVGTLVKCTFSATFTSGIYEITAASSSSITIDLSSGGLGAETVELWIGGAFPDIVTAMNDSTLSEDPDGTYRKRYICVNVNQEVDAVSDFVAESSEQALREDDGSRKIIGFYDSISVVQPDAGYRVVSDIDEGGTYYGGAWQAFKSDNSFTDVRPNGKWIEWNANGNDIVILELNTSNFEMRNFKVHNTIADASAEDAVFHIDTANINTRYINCQFTDSSNWQLDDLVASGGAVIDCYFDDSLDIVDLVDFTSASFVNCIISLGTKTNGVANATNCNFISTLVHAGTIGLNLPVGCSVINGIMFNQTTDCVLMDADGQYLNMFYNTIFSPIAAADNAIDIGDGSLGSGFNNIIYSATAGAVLTVPIKHDQIAPDPPLPVATIEKDPQFVNPADGDFRLRASSPALNGGMRSLFDGWTTIGASGPYSSPNAGYRPRYNFKGHNYSDR